MLSRLKLIYIIGSQGPSIRRTGPKNPTFFEDDYDYITEDGQQPEGVS
jgi:hypothetical protein